MKARLILFCAVLAGEVSGTTLVAPCTELDKALFCLPGMSQKEILDGYMRRNNLSDSEMLGLLERNYLDNATNAASVATDRFQSARKSVGMLWYLPGDEATRALEKYAGEAYHEEIRRTAVGAVVHKTGLASLPFASNVMAQAWRTSNEHDEVRRRYFDQAKSAPPEDRAKYVEFLKWASANAHLGGLIKTWDANIVDLEPSWRTNPLRRASAAFQVQHALPNDIASNNVLSVIRDYELAAGIRQPDAPPEEAPVAPPPAPPPAPGPLPPLTVVPRDVAPPRAAPDAPPDTSAPRSNAPLVALGAVLLAALAAFGVWRHKSKGRPL